MTQPWSTKKNKRVEQRIIQRKEERDTLVKEEVKKINMTLGPGFSVSAHLSVCWPILIHFLFVPQKWRWQRAIFCGTVLFLSSLVSVHVTWSALYVFTIHTLINQCDKCLPLASTYRSYSYSTWLYIWPRYALASPSLIWNLHIGCKTGKPGIVLSCLSSRLAWSPTILLWPF